MKKLLLALPFVLASSMAHAAIELGKGVSVSVDGELDLIARGNNPIEGSPVNGNPKSGLGVLPEAIATISLDGRHESSIGDVIWKVSQKVDTDSRYDSFGQKEAWLGLDTKIGTLALGNQVGLIYDAADRFAAAGTGNVFADLGAYATQYTRAAMYKTPSMAGVSLALQASVPNYVHVKGIEGSGAENKLHSQYSYDALLSYDNYGVKANLGYTYGKNGKNKFGSPFLATFFSSTDRGYYNNVIEQRSDNSTVLGTVSYNHSSGLMVGAGYKYDYVKATLDDSEDGLSVNKSNINSLLLLAGYSFGNNKITVGYTMIADIKTEDKYETATVKKTLKNSAINQVAIQYDRALSENVGVFVSGRYQHIGDAAYLSVYGNSFDGQVAHKKDSGRVLIGIKASV